MSQQDQTPSEQIPAAEETLIEFPTDFPIKVMGETHDDFTSEITRTIQAHLPEFDTHLIEIRGSSNGKYLSLTCLVYVTSKPQLDEIYRSLTSHPMVKVVL
ncbi:MAG: DUF493 domain-containing protein [Methylophilus sp.]|uniref:HP0495 family protein n=1 Tax=Methylophilus sp. TaxID=29541 RepID=UPI002C1AC96D|nr:DUF493 domain-containing protein [Methylophilus sp.]HSH86474.1 DUF493 domain-containing protein [Methylophilus sp.]